MANTAVIKSINALKVSASHNVQHINQLGLLSIPLMTEKRVLKMEDISFMRSDSNYTIINLQNEKLMVSKTLKWFVPKMNHLFVRVHQSFLVNLKSIYSYNFKEHYLVLKDSTKIPVSRTQRKALLAILN